MTPGAQLDTSWMWHPTFSEERSDTAGLFVHFRKTITIDDHDEALPTSVRIHITADTRYKLYINGDLINYGPVKGDEHLWFYDELDIAHHLHTGENIVHVVVLRFFHATKYAPSFPRLPLGGLRIVPASKIDEIARGLAALLQSGPSWLTAIDKRTVLRVDEPEDDFLHVYEQVGDSENASDRWTWMNAMVREVRTSTGNSAPWHLSPRMIPPMEGKSIAFKNVRNVKSSLSKQVWTNFFTCRLGAVACVLHLSPGTTHRVDLEAPEHVTAFVKLLFQRAPASGSRITLTYAESYEDEPRMIPYLRNKGHRLDDTKEIYGPSDTYRLKGPLSPDDPVCEGASPEVEVIAPYHWRTFRLIRLKIDVGCHELVLKSFAVRTATYPLVEKASVEFPSDHMSQQLWDTSIRTLRNCMHDSYEDCPMYEQLQYAMDTRSSILFTYCCSGDDRLARQAITQLHNTYQPAIGLTHSRSPSHKPQVIPHFSLYWILMLRDHFDHFNDADFIRQFLPVADAVLAYFERRVSTELGLVVCDRTPGIWNFVDWVEEWRPYGIPPSVEASGISTYTNLLYAYTLKNIAVVVFQLGRSCVAEEYLARANDRIQAVLKHCFDGSFFTDSLAHGENGMGGYSQHSQVWAVLSGAVSQEQGQKLLASALQPQSGFAPTSISMSFYTLRALSAAGGSLYDEAFHRFWEPWRQQLALGLTTWEEDSVSQRSDCHAWGSAPIHEMVAEVAGITPLRAGWSAVCIRPRIALYRSFSATVPVILSPGGITGAISVVWEKQAATNDVAIALSFRFPQAVVVPVQVELPGEPVRLIDSTSDVTFVARLAPTKAG